MKEKLVGMIVRNKGLFVKGGVVVAAVVGALIVGAVVMNKMTDPDSLVNGLVEEALGSDITNPV